MKAKLIPIRPAAPLDLALSDAALVAACGSGDLEALGVLYDRYAREVHRFISRLTYVPRDDVEDLLQEVFLAAFRSASRFQRESSVKTWIFGIAANLARRLARSGKRGRLARAEVALQVVSTRPDPEGEIFAREAIVRLQQGLARLPYTHRVAFVMCHLEHVPGPEAAVALGVPIGTLYRRLHEARTRLAKHMDGTSS